MNVNGVKTAYGSDPNNAADNGLGHPVVLKVKGVQRIYELIPSLEETDPSAPTFMAGLYPAIQTCGFRDWMPGTSPGMTVRVTNNETWYYM